MILLIPSHDIPRKSSGREKKFLPRFFLVRIARVTDRSLGTDSRILRSPNATSLWLGAACLRGLADYAQGGIVTPNAKRVGA